METKTCTKCGETKVLSEFPNGRGKLGRRSQCRKCKQMAAKEWRAKNKDKVREWLREYKRKNKDHIKAMNSTEKHKEVKRKWKKNNPEKIRNQNQRMCEKLTDGYVHNQLRKISLLVTPELVVMKRTQLQIHRAIKTQKQIIQEVSNAE